MHLTRDIKRFSNWLGSDLKLNPIQLLMLMALLAVPVLLVVDSTYNTRYELQANYQQMNSDQGLIEELAKKNRQISGELAAKNQMIDKQSRQLAKLESSNQDLTGTLAATQSQLAAEQEECAWGDWECYFDKKDKKKHD